MDSLEAGASGENPVLLTRKGGTGSLAGGGLVLRAGGHASLIAFLFSLFCLFFRCRCYGGKNAGLWGGERLSTVAGGWQTGTAVKQGVQGERAQRGSWGSHPQSLRTGLQRWAWKCNVTGLCPPHNQRLRSLSPVCLEKPLTGILSTLMAQTGAFL